MTILCNLKSVDFLEVTFDLCNNLYKPYRKPNNKPIYIKKTAESSPKCSKTAAKIHRKNNIRYFTKQRYI